MLFTVRHERLGFQFSVAGSYKQNTGGGIGIYILVLLLLISITT